MTRTFPQYSIRYSILVLTTRGAKTGALRKVPIVPLVERQNVYVIASLGGAPKNPIWVHNLRANPQVEIRDETAVRVMRAREVTDPSERARLWALAVAAFPPATTRPWPVTQVAAAPARAVSRATTCRPCSGV